jgi:hypothetical protein
MRGPVGRARDDGPVVPAITCPRCGRAADVRFYGPCASCRDGLRATLGNEAKAVEAAAFEPSMHVTPNAVALKDD